MYPFDYVPFLDPAVLGPPVAAVFGACGAIKFGPPVVRRARQRAYDEACAAEAVRLVIAPTAAMAVDPGAATALIRALHPHQRRGIDAWRVGWPSVELRVVWCGGALAWELIAGRQVATGARHALAARYPGVHIDEAPVGERPAAATAVGRLTASSRWPLREPEAGDAGALHGLAAALAAERPSAEVRLRLVARPVPPDAWRREVAPEPRDHSIGIGRLVGHAIVEGLLFHPESTLPEPDTPRTLTADERAAAQRRRAGMVGFDVGLVLEVAGIPAAAAEALLWRLVDFTHPLADPHQAIGWTIRRGAVGNPPRARLTDWETALLWYLPDASIDGLGAGRSRPLAPARAGPVADEAPGIVIGQSRGRPLAIPADGLARHMAIFGATGSGKSTLLLHLVAGLAAGGCGATVVDPHGDLATDILGRLPASAAGRVHVLRLGDRAHPRGFNFLERRSVDEAELVASEFVYMLEDLWPRFCGPKMQHYLRHGLLTLLSDERPQTILELVRILTDDAFRRPFVERLDDPTIAAFWRTQWPGPAERERDTSIKAVLNKLGAFITYGSIRDIVGQGESTLRPRALMDRGDILIVDLSRVGGDNATLFGAMLITRFYVDAVGRQGTDAEARRPHVLVVDEAQRFDTRALSAIAIEGRKFGLRLVLATQSWTGLGERLRSTILTNAASLALLSPGADDVRAMARLFEPIPPDELLRLGRFELALRLDGPDGRPHVVDGRIAPPGPADGRAAEALIAASDARDARPLEHVRAEVRRRAGGGPAGRKSAGTDPTLTGRQ